MLVVAGGSDGSGRDRRPKLWLPPPRNQSRSCARPKLDGDVILVRGATIMTDDWGRAPFRAWLYRIATNACLDFLARHERHVVELSAQGAPSSPDATVPHVEWLQPSPRPALEIDPLAQRDADALVIRRETIELAFLVTLQYLPPKQRAVLILRLMVGYSHALAPFDQVAER